MAGVLADQGHVRRQGNSPPPTAGVVQRLEVTPQNVLALATAFRDVVAMLDAAAQNVAGDLMLPRASFLGDPHSKWAVEQFNEYFAAGELSFANVVTRLITEHKRTFNALKAVADSYGKT